MTRRNFPGKPPEAREGARNEPNPTFFTGGLKADFENAQSFPRHAPTVFTAVNWGGEPGDPKFGASGLCRAKG